MNIFSLSHPHIWPAILKPCVLRVLYGEPLNFLALEEGNGRYQKHQYQHPIRRQRRAAKRPFRWPPTNKKDLRGFLETSEVWNNQPLWRKTG